MRELFILCCYFFACTLSISQFSKMRKLALVGYLLCFFRPVVSSLSVTSMAKASLPCSALSSHFSLYFFPFLVGAFPGGFVANLFLGVRCLDLAKGIYIAGLFPGFASNRTSSSSSKMLAKSSATSIYCALSFALCTLLMVLCHHTSANSFRKARFLSPVPALWPHHTLLHEQVSLFGMV